MLTGYIYEIRHRFVKFSETVSVLTRHAFCC